MVCHRDPTARQQEAARERAAEIALATPQQELLTSLGKVLDRLTLDEARRAAERREEGIYGFFLMHEYFAMFSTVVFTDREFRLACEQHPEEEPVSARWAFWWPSFTDFGGPELERTVHALDLQERAMPRDEESPLLREIQRLCLVALRRVRGQGVLGADVVLALGAVEQSAEETFLYAEQLCNSDTLMRFRRELPWISEADLEMFRTHGHLACL